MVNALTYVICVIYDMQTVGKMQPEQVIQAVRIEFGGKRQTRGVSQKIRKNSEPTAGTCPAPSATTSPVTNVILDYSNNFGVSRNAALDNQKRKGADNDCRVESNACEQVVLDEYDLAGYFQECDFEQEFMLYSDSAVSDELVSNEKSFLEEFGSNVETSNTVDIKDIAAWLFP